MPFATFKTLDLGTIAAGASKEVEWDSDDDYMLYRLYFVEKTGASLSNVVGTVWIDATSLSKEDVPVRLFGTDVMTAVILDIPLGKGRKFKVAVKNNYAEARNVFATLELHK